MNMSTLAEEKVNTESSSHRPLVQLHRIADGQIRQAGALDQLPYQKVCRHDEHRGHQLQPAEKPQIQPEHIGKVALQDAAENTA